MQQFRRQSVTKRLQRIGQLTLVDRSRTVLVEMAEDALPILNVLPQAGKLVEADLAAAVHVEHAHQHLDRVEVERGPVAIDQRLAEFLRVDLAATVAIDCDEPLPELRVSARGRSGRGVVHLRSVVVRSGCAVG